jgi:hypothetical protein
MVSYRNFKQSKSKKYISAALGTSVKFSKNHHLTSLPNIVQ